MCMILFSLDSRPKIWFDMGCYPLCSTFLLSCAGICEDIRLLLIWFMLTHFCADYIQPWCFMNMPSL